MEILLKKADCSEMLLITSTIRAYVFIKFRFIAMLFCGVKFIGIAFIGTKSVELNVTDN